MFPFARDSKNSEPVPEGAQAAPAPAAAAHPLDALTGGVFSAATSGERAQRVRDWLATDPAPEDMQTVYKELSAKDRGASRALRDRLEELRRAKAQEAIADEWRAKGQALLDAARLHIADALAWQRDAAQAGAPLAREPLAGIRDRLTQRVKAVEDLQQRVMVQREAGALLAQRIELLSTHSWTDARDQRPGLDRDIAAWRATRDGIGADPDWSSVELRFPPQLEQAAQQVDTVWAALTAALDQAEAAAADASAPLPSVQVWAEELRAARAPAAAPVAPVAAVDPQVRVAATRAVEAGVKLLEQAVTAGHTKNMHSAAQALRKALKVHGQLIDDALVARVHQTLVSAGELQGWQRWSADQLREELVARAEALLQPRTHKPRKARKGKADARDEARTEEQKPALPAPLADENSAASELAPQVDAEARAEQARPEASAAAVTEPQAVAAIPSEIATPGLAPVETEVDKPAAAAAPVADEARAGVAETPVPAAPTEGVTADAEAQASATAADGAARAEAAAEPAVELMPTLRGRKLQDEIRKLRDEWKTADRGGAPNQALWHRFDRACNAAYQFVESWLQQVRAQEEQAVQERTALIEEVRAWTQAQPQAQPGAESPDWKAASRQLHRYTERWRNAGHVGEKAYGKLQPQWKAAIKAAEAPFASAQKDNRAQRHALIAEAVELGAAPTLRIDAIKDLQRRWQEEARAVPLPRKVEQKLWDAFRKPLDEAFQRRSAQRDEQRARLSAHDQAVLNASKALEAATASGDAAQIRAAMEQLEAASRGEAAEAAPASAPASASPAGDAATAVAPPTAGAAAATPTGDQSAPVQEEGATTEDGTPAAADAKDAAEAALDAAESAAQAAPAPVPAPVKRVVAVRGDDRPGAQRRDMRAGGDRDRDRQGRGDRRMGDRRDDRRRERPGDDRRGFDRRGPREDRGPRLGQAAFRAQRDAASHAQAALRELAAQAHGEALVRLIGAWQDHQVEQIPASKDLGRAVTSEIHSGWKHAVGQSDGNPAQAAKALLRLEIAADIPAAAAQLEARRAMQLQLLVHRNDPAPVETWGQDAARVLSAPYDDAVANRLRAALKVLLRRG